MIRTLSITERPRNPFSLSDSEPFAVHRTCMKLHDRIRAARTAAGLSQRQLARALGVSPSAVAQWELDDTKPTHEHLFAIAAATNCDAAKMFGLEPQSMHSDAALDALIAHWRRLPLAQRGMVLRLVLAATQDDAPRSKAAAGVKPELDKPPEAA